MSTKWTEDQRKVIELRDRDLLVSAAAGSGKTAVLIERILGLITDVEHPIDIDRLLVVTFTRAAAGEMRERLNQAIEQRLSVEEENEHLVRQLTLIQNAQITTIDSFCSFVLKNYFHVIGLDPNYRVMDEGEGKLLKSQVVQELLEERYAEASEEFSHFVECMATGKNDQVLEDSILRLYEFAMSYPYPEKWLEECSHAYRLEKFQEFLDAAWVGELMNSVKMLLKDLKELSEEALSICRELGGPYMYEEAILSDCETLGRFLGAGDYQALYEAMEQQKGWTRLSAKKDELVLEEKKNLVKAIREQVKDGIKEIREQYFPEPPKEAFEDLKAAGRPVAVLVELTLSFMERFGAEKREKNLLDFHDMEHLALQILVKEEDGKTVPTDTARELSRQFEEIMIDEYQDSNLVQEAILTAVSRESEGGHNLFMVGDVKQSIYRFRLARPELFLSKYQTYTREASESQRIDLSQNFRSRREILAFTNQIFREIMGENLGRIVYDEAAALYPGAEYPKVDPEKLAPELLFFDADESPELIERVRMTSAELEARMTGQKILSMVGREEVYDKETKGMRPMEFRDIVILFRSPTAFAESYGKILGDMGIPVYVGSRSGYFSAREIQVVLSLLSIIDNPSQDIPLAAVLLSPIGGLSEKDTALIKSGGGQERSFHESCLWYLANGEEEGLREKLRAFYGMLSDFRSRVPYMPIHELLWYIFDYTGYEDYVAAMPAGEQRALNLKMLVEKAWDYEKTSYRGLFNFIRYIDNLQKYDVDYGEAGIMGEEKNVVRIMSIHKSKGLEFPVVFLGGLQKQFNQQDTRSRLVLDVDLGAGFDMVDTILRVRRSTLFKRCIQKKVKDDNTGEEIRVLYVALTRAREKLILTGVLSGLPKKTEVWYQGTNPNRMGLSYRQLSEAGSYLDFLMPVLLKYESASTFLREMGITPKGFFREEDPVWGTGFSIRRVDIQDLLADEMGRQVTEQFDLQSLNALDSEKMYDEEFRALLKERLEGTYPFGDGSRIPMKLTVSQLKKQSEREESEEGEILFPEENREEKISKEKDWAVVGEERERFAKGSGQGELPKEKDWAVAGEERERFAKESGQGELLKEKDWAVVGEEREHFAKESTQEAVSKKKVQTADGEPGKLFAGESGEEVSSKEKVQAENGESQEWSVEKSGRAVNFEDHKASTESVSVQPERDTEDSREKPLQHQDGPEEIIPAFMKEHSEVQGAARGTAYHIFLQYMDFTRCATLAEVKAQLASLQAKGRLSPEEAAAIDCRRIIRLASSELGKRMAQAQKKGDLFREQHFVYAVPAKSVYSGLPLERELLIQGVIDAYFEEEGSLVLVDYKTDFVKPGEAAELCQKYEAQLNYYAKALEQLTQKPVREKILYSMFLQKALRIK